ncbi:TPA: oligosaccharide flippase family protein [Enterobacter cloacae]
MKKQIAKNITSNFLNLTISIAIGLILTPVLVKKLGVSVYGLIPIALFLTFYMGVIAQSLTASVNRFLIEKFISNEIQQASEIFSTSFTLIVFYVSILSALLLLPILHIGYFLNIPTGYQSDAINLFLAVLFSFAIAMLSSSISVSMYAKNRINLMQIGNIVRNISKVSAIFIFLEMGFVSLTFIGISIILSEVFYLLYAIIIWRILTPELEIKLKFFKKNRAKEITAFSGWVFFDQIGTILFLKTDLILVNMLMGSKANGEYSVATQFSDLLRSMAGLVASSLGPVMVIMYEKQQLKQLADITIAFVKFLSLTLAVPIIILCVYSKEILDLWLGADFVKLAPLMTLMVLPLIINLGTLPILSINIAVKKIKIPAVVNIILALSGIFLSLIIYYKTSLGYYSIAIAYTLTLTIKNALFIPWYAAAIMNKPRYTFFTTHLKSVIFSIIFLTSTYYLKKSMQPIDLNIILQWVVLVIVGFSMTLFFYTKSERQIFISFLKRNKN